MVTISDLNFDYRISALRTSQAALWGFNIGKSGTHASRTMMLKDLSLLFEFVPPDAKRKVYANAVLVENCLGKPTAITRRKSLQHLRHLYALDSEVILFRVFRSLWTRDEKSRPLLAILLALARDPLLRPTFAAVACTPLGQDISQHSLRAILVNAAGDRLNATTLAAATSRAASSWTQSGHLHGHRYKRRQKAEPTATSAAFALLLGFALGQRGQLLFETPWIAVLDAAPDVVMEMAFEAKRLGLLELKQSGALIDVSFSRLLTEKEQEKINGAH